MIFLSKYLFKHPSYQRQTNQKTITFTFLHGDTIQHQYDVDKMRRKTIKTNKGIIIEKNEPVERERECYLMVPGDWISNASSTYIHFIARTYHFSSQTSQTNKQTNKQTYTNRYMEHISCAYLWTFTCWSIFSLLHFVFAWSLNRGEPAQQGADLQEITDLVPTDYFQSKQLSWRSKLSILQSNNWGKKAAIC